MAQPSPYLVSPSTTFVQVDILQNPYTPVILNTVSYAGQTVSVLDGTSSFGVLQEPIVVSTAYTSLFADGTFSTLINQPQGFITVQTQLPNTWSFLNSFPFRNQYLSAGALNITTSTMTTAVISTLFESVSSVVTENLVVTASFLQSTNAAFNTNISSLGIVTFTSTLNVYDSTFFSTAFSTAGAAYFYSSVTIQNSLTIQSALQTLSSMYISGSVYTLGNISAPLINLRDGLVGTSLEIQQSTGISTDLANSIYLTSNLSTLSSVFIGEDFNTSNLYIKQNAIFLSSVTVKSGFIVTGSISFSSILSSLQDIAVGGNLGVSGPTTIASTIYANKNITITNTLDITGNLSTYYAEITRLGADGNFYYSSFSTSIFGVSSFSNVGIENAEINILSVYRSVILDSNLSFLTTQSSFFGSTLVVQGSISSIQSSLINGYGSIGGLSTFTSLYVANSTFLEGNLNIGGTFFTNSLGSASTVVEGDLSVLGLIQVQGVVELSSITLVSSVVSENFIVSTLQVGYKGVISNTFISSLYTSSLLIGTSQNSKYTAEIAIPFDTISTYTNYLSAAVLNLSGPRINTYLNVLSSFAINTEPVLNQVTIEGNAQLYSSVTIFQIISTQAAYGTFDGYHAGDGRLVNNLSYPNSLNLDLLFASTLYTSTLSTGYLVASTGFVFNTYYPSTVAIDIFNIFGNADSNFIPQTSTNYIISYPLTGAPLSNGITINTMLLNNIKINRTSLASGAQGTGCVTNINEWLLDQFILSQSNTLAVGGTARVSSLNVPTFAFPFVFYNADVFIVKEGPHPSAQLYLSSGYITSFEENPRPLFIGEQQPPISSVIQPYQSTIILNNTVYVDQKNNRVGIYTSSPNYSLDTPGVTNIYGSMKTSTIQINEELRLHQNVSSYWFAGGTGAIGSLSNLHVSQDGETWTDFTGTVGTTSTIKSLAYNGSKWVACFDEINAPIRYLNAGETTWTFASNNGINPPRSVAWNGTMFVVTGFSGQFNSIQHSFDGQTWSPAASGGFNTGLSNTGGYGVAWNGYEWVVVGIANTTENSIQYSANGSNWSDVNSITGLNGTLSGVCWAGRRWIATQKVGATGFNTLISDDTLNWKLGGQDHFYTKANAIAFNGNIVVAVGDAPSNLYTSTIQYSFDYGGSWNISQGAGFSTTIGGLCVAWNGSYWLAGGEDGYRKSYDGVTWFIPPNNPGYQVDSLGWSSNTTPVMSLQYPFPDELTITNISSRWIMGGSNNPNDFSTIQYSDDGGITWNSNVTNSFSIETNNVRVDFNTGMWVAVGDSGNDSTIKYSYTNGTSWINDTTNLSGAPLQLKGFGLKQGASLGGGQTRWIAGMSNSFWSGTGSPSTIFYAANSNTSNWSVWAPADYNPPFSTLFTGACYNIEYDGIGTYVAVGTKNPSIFGGANGGIIYSSDGSVWSDQTTNSFVSGFMPGQDAVGYGVVYGSSMFVAVGYDATNNNIKYSGDGINWSNAISGQFSQFGRSVAYNGSDLWVAVGFDFNPGGTIKYSGNAINWSNAASGAFDQEGTNIAYDSNTGRWIAVGKTLGFGTRSTICYSDDGSNWTYPSPQPFTEAGTAIGVYATVTSFVQSNSPSSFLSLYRNPVEGIQYQISTPFISYNPSTLSLNNSLLFDQDNNIYMGGYLSTSVLEANNYESTLIVSGSAFVSSFTSSFGTIVNSLFYNYAVVL